MKVKTLLVLIRCTESARGFEAYVGMCARPASNTLIKIKCIHSDTLTTSLLLVRMVFACPWCSFLIFSHSIFKRWKGQGWPFDTQGLINNALYHLPYLWCWFGEFHIASTNDTQIDIFIFLYSHYLSAWYSIDTVRRNSVLIIQG